MQKNKTEKTPSTTVRSQSSFRTLPFLNQRKDYVSPSHDSDESGDTIILEDTVNSQLHCHHQDNSLQEDLGNSQQPEDHNSQLDSQQSDDSQNF